MASYTYDDFRKVLRNLGFEEMRKRKHETWRKVLPNGDILRVRISHKHGSDISKWFFYEMLRQAGLNEEEFRKILKEKEG